MKRHNTNVATWNKEKCLFHLPYPAGDIRNVGILNPRNVQSTFHPGTILLVVHSYIYLII